MAIRLWRVSRGLPFVNSEGDKRYIDKGVLVRYNKPIETNNLGDTAMFNFTIRDNGAAVLKSDDVEYTVVMLGFDGYSCTARTEYTNRTSRCIVGYPHQDFIWEFGEVTQADLDRVAAAEAAHKVRLAKIAAEAAKKKAKRG